jgi:hypothetical protein
MPLLTAVVLFAQAQEVQIDPAVEGRKVIIGMLIVGLIFIAVIALGQLATLAAFAGRLRYKRSARARGRVVSQRPRFGACRVRGARVHLILSRGRR